MKVSLKKAFTLVESLITMLIISAVLIVSLYVLCSYYNYAHMRNTQMLQITKNINLVEQLKSEVHTVSDLYEFFINNHIRIIAVGKGEINLIKKQNGDIEALRSSDEDFGFSEILKPDNLYRVEINGTVPNTKIISILWLEDG